MVNNLNEFYTGGMAPPMRLPGGGFAPSPQTLNSSELAQYQAWYQTAFPNAAPSVRSIEVNPDGTPKSALQTLAPPSLPLNPPLPPLPSNYYGPQSDRWGPFSTGKTGQKTAEGLNIRPVQSVQIDPMTGNPVTQVARNTMAGSVQMPPGIVPQSIQIAFAHMPSPSSLAGKSLLSAGLSLTGRNNSIAAMNANDVVQSRPYQAQPSTVNAATPLDAYRLGLTNPPRVPPPVQAIAQATKQIQVPNPAYAAYRASIGNDVKDTHGKVNVQPPPQYIIKTVPSVPALPAGINPQSKAGRLISLISSLLPSQPIAGVNTPGLPQGAYDPRVDVTGRSQQHNAGGWGINAGGGIVPF